MKTNEVLRKADIFHARECPSSLEGSHSLEECYNGFGIMLRAVIKEERIIALAEQEGENE